MPSLNNAPEFFAFGQLPSSTRNVGKYAITYVADNSANVARLGLETMHEKALEFLAKVVVPPAESPPVERSLLVIWVGVHEHLGHAGGAAGSRSFVANYNVGKPENEEINAARTMAVLAHEQFHQLADLARGPLPPLPTWLNESLAHYYALKAMTIVAVSSDASNSVYSRFVDPQRPVTLGLLELNRRYAANDRSVYPSFYEQGATFWSELDLAISHVTRGASSLDELVPELLRSATTHDDRLPLSFVLSMRERIGAAADDLLREYVGD